MTNWTQHAAAAAMPFPIPHSPHISFPIRTANSWFLYENEIFIGRLCFRYISWIVINFIDNCHVLMAWLCAWLSDCLLHSCCRSCCKLLLLLLLLLRAWHIQCKNIFPIFFLLFLSFFCLLAANCFQRKLLHAQRFHIHTDIGQSCLYRSELLWLCNNNKKLNIKGMCKIIILHAIKRWERNKGLFNRFNAERQSIGWI